MSIFLFNAAWYLVAEKLPSPIRGMVIVTAAIAIAFTAAKILGGSREMFPRMANTDDPRLVVSIAAIMVIIVIVLLPPLILYLMGVR